MEKIIKLLKVLTAKKFYGSITIKFEAGKIIYIRKEEVIKI